MIDTIKEVAGQAVEGLKQQPLLLALVTLQVVTLGVAVWAGNANRTAERERFALIIAQCGPK